MSAELMPLIEKFGVITTLLLIILIAIPRYFLPTKSMLEQLRDNITEIKLQLIEHNKLQIKLQEQLENLCEHFKIIMDKLFFKKD